MILGVEISAIVKVSTYCEIFSFEEILFKNFIKFYSERQKHTSLLGRRL